VIGQNVLKETLNSAIAHGFPRFSIIIGPQGSGKKMIVDYIAEATGFTKAVCGNKVEEIREIIRTAYDQTSPVIYVFYDIDDMSVSAKNALLKVTEEPPNNAIFIMTISSENKALETILSRAVRFNLDVYSYSELKEYVTSVSGNKRYNVEDILSIADVPGDINTLMEYDFPQFFAFCNQVADNIAFVETANALKIVEKLAIKEEGWDVKLFISAIKNILIRIQEETGYSSYKAIKVCTDYINQLNNKSLNKRMLCDSWIFDMQEALR